MAESRKHHFVPQLYQRGFARQSGKVWKVIVLDRATGQTRGPMSVRDVFAERDYNTIVDADGNRTLAVEQLLAEHVEDAAKYGLEMLRLGAFPLWPAHRQEVALFMSAQLSRGRNVRAGLSNAISEVMSMALSISAQNADDEHFTAAIGRPLQADERERLIHNREHMIIRPTNAALLNATLANLDEIARMLLMRTWTLVVFDKPCLFTGEHPVAHINPSGESYGYGVATAERLYMPVSTTNGLVLSMPWARWPETVVYGTDELARRLNWAMLTQPANAELLLHPDIAGHPLPTAATLQKDTHWPWGPDPNSAPPPFLQLLGRRSTGRSLGSPRSRPETHREDCPR